MTSSDSLGAQISTLPIISSGFDPLFERHGTLSPTRECYGLSYNYAHGRSRVSRKMEDWVAVGEGADAAKKTLSEAFSKPQGELTKVPGITFVGKVVVSSGNGEAVRTIVSINNLGDNDTVKIGAALARLGEAGFIINPDIAEQYKIAQRDMTF